jgi:hypothetical protein
MERYMVLRDWIDVDKIDWYYLPTNPSAIHLLEQNPDKIDWDYLSTNPAIFTYDYPRLYQSRTDLHKEYTEYFWKITTMQKWINQYCTPDEDGIELYTYFHA